MFLITYCIIYIELNLNLLYGKCPDMTSVMILFYMNHIFIESIIMLFFTDFVVTLPSSHITVWQYPQEWKDGSVLENTISPNKNGAMCLMKVRACWKLKRWCYLAFLFAKLLLPFMHPHRLDISVSPGRTYQIYFLKIVLDFYELFGTEPLSFYITFM